MAHPKTDPHSVRQKRTDPHEPLVNTLRSRMDELGAAEEAKGIKAHDDPDKVMWDEASTAREQAETSRDEDRAGKEHDIRRDEAAFTPAGGGALVSDGEDWEYNFLPDGTIEITKAPEANRTAVGLTLDKGDKYYDAINTMRPLGPDIKGIESKDELSLSQKVQAQAIAEGDADRRDEGRVVDGYNIRSIADRVAARSGLNRRGKRRE